MKKQLLITTGILVSGLMSGQVAQKATKIPGHLANIAVLKSSKVDDRSTNSTLPYQAKVQKQITKNVQRVSTITENVVGSTGYDLQSNSSVGDRIVVNADGTIATCWTYSGVGDGTYADRGTGYAYFNGSSWSAIPTARVENARVGWGNIVNTRSGREMVLSHNGGASKLHLASRNAKGVNTWTNSTTAVPTATTGGNFWPRMVSSHPAGGDTVYAISLTYPTASGGAMWQGLDGAVVFHRSVNAGVTWDINNVVPAGLTSATFLGFGGDAYAIAAKGSTVAIVAGDSGKDLVLTKSTDGGVTWSAKTVLKFPLPLWDYETTTTDIDNDGVADTLDTNDGNFAVGLDNNGLAYVSYGAMRILNDAPSASGYSYFPYTDGLYLWNESMPQDVGGTIVAAIEDLGEQGTIYFPAQTDPSTLAFGRFGCSLTSYPSMAFDANNTLYLSYCSIVDSLISVTNAEKVLRHAFIIKSCDGGQNFTNPFDVVDNSSAPYEGMFASMAKNVDGNVHLIYERDYFPGYGVPPSSGTNPDDDNLGDIKDMVYVKVPVGDLGNCPIITGIKETSSAVAAMNFYPNPASSNATIEVVLNENTKMEIAILNAVGQTIYSTSVSGNTGNNKVDVNLSNLSAGLYFYQVKVGNNKSVTKKFAVEK